MSWGPANFAFFPFLNAVPYCNLFPFLFTDESGCEADMAEGSVEEESGEMLGPTTATVLQPPAPSNVSAKDEVSFASRYNVESCFSSCVSLSERELICNYVMTSLDF